MIQPESLTLAATTAAVFADAGQIVAARPGTVIGELTRLSMPYTGTVEIGRDNGAMDWVNAAVVDSNGSLDNPSEHDRELDACIKDISKAVVTHVAFARNTVKPLVEEFAEKYFAACEANKAPDATQAFEIVTLRLPEVLKDESFLDIFSYYKDRSVLTPDLPLSLSTKSHDELHELILTGNERFDRLILEWLSQKNERFLESVWNSFFTREQITPGQDPGWNLMSYEDLRAANAFDKADAALAIFLFARKITVQVQDETGMSLSAYKNICTQFTDYAGALVVDALKKIDIFIESKALVIEQSDYLKILKVNGEIYSAWLESGGTPEMLMGMLVSGVTMTSQSLIDNKRDELLRQWNSFVTFYRTNESNKLHLRMRALLDTLFIQMLDTAGEEEKQYWASNTAYFDGMVKSMRDLISILKTEELSDHHTMALYLIANIRFGYTCAYQILRDINEAHRVNPNVDVREAALLAVINYVSDYAADQLTLVQG